MIINPLQDSFSSHFQLKKFTAQSPFFGDAKKIPRVSSTDQRSRDPGDQNMGHVLRFLRPHMVRPACSFKARGDTLHCSCCNRRYPSGTSRVVLQQHARKQHGLPLPKHPLVDKAAANRKLWRERVAASRNLPPSTKVRKCGALLDSGVRRCQKRRVGTGASSRCSNHPMLGVKDALCRGVYHCQWHDATGTGSDQLACGGSPPSATGTGSGSPGEPALTAPSVPGPRRSSLAVPVPVYPPLAGPSISSSDSESDAAVTTGKAAVTGRTVTLRARTRATRPPGPLVRLERFPGSLGLGVVAVDRIRPLDMVTAFCEVPGTRSLPIQGPGRLAEARHSNLSLTENRGYRLKLPGLPVLTGVCEPIVGQGIASFINSNYRLGVPANVRFVSVGGLALVRAIADISPGQQLLVSYGTGYKFSGSVAP